MVNLQSSELDLLFYALSDPTRRLMLKMLNDGTHTISALAEPFKMSLAAVSKHVKILDRAKLLNRRKIGRVHECTMNAEALKSAEECLQFYTEFWNHRLDLLAEKLESKKNEEVKPKKRGK
jgi:DNA-binding transcriptional ArsR family regulator